MKKALIIAPITLVIIGVIVVTLYVFDLNQKIRKFEFENTITLYENETVTPKDFVKNSTLNNVNIEFENDIYTSIPGTYENYLNIRGIFVFSKKVKVSYEVKAKDITPPTIEGAKDKSVYLGETIDYNDGVTVTDDINQNITLEVDSSDVDLNTVGTYIVTYKANDGYNETLLPITVTVIDKTVTQTSVVYPSDGKIVYLTFDDGPSYYTPQILEILKQNGVVATFFVTNQFPSYSNYYNIILNEGHALALHTYSHKYKIYSSMDTYFNDLILLENKIYEATGIVPQKVIRFPGGSSNTVSKKYAKGIMKTLATELKARGYNYFDWNCDTGDGLSKATSENEIKNVKKCLGMSTINLLAHDIKAQTVEAMKTIIPMLKENGYTFKTIDMTTPEVHHKVVN